MPRVFDISQPLHAGLPVWPGDTSFKRDDTWTISDECPVKVSKLTLSTHSGAHADAPEHYGRDGVDIASVPLKPYLGECSVRTVNGTDPQVQLDEINWDRVTYPERLLMRTYQSFPHDAWDHNFRAIHPDVIKKLAGLGGLLIGTDAASIDPETSKSLDAHKAVEAADMRILEGLVFDGVPDGDYELIALPLPIQNADASPVRAILRELS
ncbi:MAG: arylformamidase [Alphaproteobacteria bacterium]|nr:arylformamidase [Alphaproteobacteria bacterium]